MNNLEKPAMKAHAKSERYEITENHISKGWKNKIKRKAPAGNRTRASSIPEWSVLTTRPQRHLIPERTEKRKQGTCAKCIHKSGKHEKPNEARYKANHNKKEKGNTQNEKEK